MLPAKEGTLRSWLEAERKTEMAPLFCASPVQVFEVVTTRGVRDTREAKALCSPLPINYA